MTNFGFLRRAAMKRREQAATLATVAETIAWTAPALSEVQARISLEAVLRMVYEEGHHGDGNQVSWKEFKRRGDRPLRDVTEILLGTKAAILLDRRVIRRGNKAAHGEFQQDSFSTRAAFATLEDLQEGLWVGLAQSGLLEDPECPPFERPPQPPSPKRQRRALREAEERVAELERDLEEAGRRAAELAEENESRAWYEDLSPRLGFHPDYAESRKALRAASESAFQALEAIERRANLSISELGAEPLDPEAPHGISLLPLTSSEALVVAQPHGTSLLFLLWAGGRKQAKDWAAAHQAEVKAQLAPHTAGEPLFGSVVDESLLDLGIGKAWIPLVKRLVAPEALAALLPLLESPRARMELPHLAPALGRRLVLPETRAELTSALEAGTTAWRMFLLPEQRRLAFEDFSGSVRVLGGAGTGKTVVALHRARYLLENHLEADERLLFTMYTSSLETNLREDMNSLLGARLAARVDLKRIDSYAMGLIDPHPTVIHRREEPELFQAAHKAVEDTLDRRQRRQLQRWSTYREEYQWAVERLGASSPDEYLGLAGSAGRVAGRKARLLAWRVFDTYERLLEQRGRWTWTGVQRKARQTLGGRPRYRAAIIDEAQDMTADRLRLIRSLVAPGPNDLFFVGDPRQSVFGGELCFSDYGVETEAFRLRMNYRTTAEIHEAAVSLLADETFEDLNGGLQRRGDDCYSLRSGPSPVFDPCASQEDERARAIRAIKEVLADGLAPSRIAVVARTWDILETLYEDLDNAGIAASLLTGRTPAGEPKTSVNLVTMHGIKGLEYHTVRVLGVGAGEVPLPTALAATESSPQLREEKLRGERSLLYVAMSRATESLTLSWTGKPSPFLDDQYVASD